MVLVTAIDRFGDPAQVRVHYSAPMNAAAGLAASYSVPGSTVSAAVLAADRRSTLLTVPDLTPDAHDLLIAETVASQAGATLTLRELVIPGFGGLLAQVAPDMLAPPRFRVFQAGVHVFHSDFAIDPTEFDITPPVVGPFSPAPGSALQASAAITFDVTDDTELKRVLVLVRYDAIGRADLAHDGTAFRDFYEGTRAAIPKGFRFTLRRRGGWPSAPTIQVLAIDNAGNEATA